LLTNHKPEPHVERRPSESTTLATLLIIFCSPFATGTKRDKGLAEASAVQYVCALVRCYTSTPLKYWAEGIDLVEHWASPPTPVDGPFQSSP
uniref:Secreted protein n=1 Tax=Mesocestoides corti TaxID=53468 RepID=A0A5K3ER02_MESCO